MGTQSDYRSRLQNFQYDGGRKAMLGQEDKYYDPIIITFPNMVARVYRPILTEEERARRLKAIHNQAANLLMKERTRERLEN
jgi:hypothetical protein